MGILKIHSECATRLKEFKLPSPIGFGTTIAPIMFSSDYKEGQWGELEMLPYGPISLDPCAKVFHYAQEIFEGMKGYKREGKDPTLFRPDENLKRFNFSARRMAMPEIPEEYFNTATTAMADYCRDFIPTQNGETLYIRPFMFATQPHIGIKPSNEYKFMVVASPSGSYFNSGSVKVLIQREFVRAVKGGTGNAKTGGNYAASLLSTENAFQKGYQQSLWLDAIEKRYIEEMSGMNFFAIINGEFHTPKLTDSILDGITRKSILKLASHLGYKTFESTLDVNELIEKIKTGECSEMFCCGTAAVITPINSLNEEDGTSYNVEKADGDVAWKIREQLLAIQEGTAEDPFNWRLEIHNKQGQY